MYKQLLLFALSIFCNVVAMKNKDTASSAIHNDLFDNPYFVLTKKHHDRLKKNPFIIPSLNNKVFNLPANLACKYKIQNLYVTLLADILPNELQNIIVKNYNSLITHTKNWDKALNHLKQLLLNHKIPKIINKIPYTIPRTHQYSHDKKYALVKHSPTKMFLYDLQTNEKMIPEKDILAACFLNKKDALVYMDINEHLMHYDIATEETTTIASYIPHGKSDLSNYWHIIISPNDLIFIIPQNIWDNQSTKLILASLDGNIDTIINNSFEAIAFNKNRSLIATSSNTNPKKITLYSFDNKDLHYLTHVDVDIKYTKLRFHNDCSITAKTKKVDSLHKVTKFNIIHKKEDNTHMLQEVITCDASHCPITFHHSKHNHPPILIKKFYDNNDNAHCSLMTIFNHNNTQITSYCPEVKASTVSKNGQFFALANKAFNEEQTITIHNLPTFDIRSTCRHKNSYFNGIRKLMFHPNNTLLISKSLKEEVIYTTTGHKLASLNHAHFCNLHDCYLNKDGTILCTAEDNYELYSSKDLEALDTTAPNHTINLLQYFALKNIDDKKRDSNGTYSVPQTLFNKLCWESFKEDEIKSLSETLNLKIEG